MADSTENTDGNEDVTCVICKSTESDLNEIFEPICLNKCENRHVTCNACKDMLYENGETMCPMRCGKQLRPRSMKQISIKIPCNEISENEILKDLACIYMDSYLKDLFIKFEKSNHLRSTNIVLELTDDQVKWLGSAKSAGEYHIYRGLRKYNQCDDTYSDYFPSSWTKNLQKARRYGETVLELTVPSECILMDSDMFALSPNLDEVILLAGSYTVKVVEFTSKPSAELKPLKLEMTLNPDIFTAGNLEQLYSSKSIGNPFHYTIADLKHFADESNISYKSSISKRDLINTLYTAITGNSPPLSASLDISHFTEENLPYLKSNIKKNNKYHCTVTQLKELASQLQIHYSSTVTKPTLIDKIYDYVLN